MAPNSPPSFFPFHDGNLQQALMALKVRLALWE